MNVSNTSSRGVVWLVAAALGTASLAAQTGGRGSAPTESSRVQAVRVAIGHGQIAEARRLAEAIPTDAGRSLASALVDIFEGKAADAQAKLEPLARANPAGDASLELGLLEIRIGQREQGWQRLNPIAAVRTFAGPDDYFRLARAAEGIHEYLLAADAYAETASVPRADIQAARGDLFLLRHKAGDAASDYRKALELDPEWVPAMIGLARALADEAPEQADQFLAAVRKLSPGHPDLWMFRAERQLDNEDAAGAAASLDRVAAARPGTREEAALRAALAYAAGDTAAVDAGLAKVAAADPRSALGYRRLGEQAARAYRFDDAAELARKATAHDPDDPYAYFDLGLYLLRVGDEPGARQALERSWSLDSSSEVTKNLLDMLDRMDSFQTVSDGDLVFKFAGDQAEVLRNYALPLAEEATRTFGSRYGFTPQGPVLIEIFPFHDDFAVRTMGLPGLVGALGACFGRVVAMDSPTARDPGVFSWQATLWHELAHVYTLQLSKYRVPRWLTEGISVFEEHRRQPAWGRELALEFAAAYGEGRSFGVKKLPDAFKDPHSLALAYFEASLLVEHLVDLNGDQGLRTLLTAYADGAKDSDAFARAFGRSVDEVEASFKTFVESRYGALSRAMADPPRQVAADDLPGLRQRAEQAPGNFISQLTLGVALLRSGDTAGARGPLERAADLAPQASGDGSPRALLAQIAEQAGERARARSELRQLLAYDHVNVNAARRLAALSGADPAADADRGFALQLVADLDPFDGTVHGLLGRRLLAAGKLQEALIEFRAAMATGPPNVAEARTDVAETLHKLGRAAEARRQVLLALQQAPGFARAQDLLLDIIGRN